MNKIGFVKRVQKDLRQGVSHTKRSIETLAKRFGIENKNQVKEFTELAIVLNARGIAHQEGLDHRQKYDAIVALYHSQVNLSMRTSMSVLMQQYSTAAPISYLASNYVLSKSSKASYFEPSAGNGLLTIALPHVETVVNELDEIRLSNLKMQPFQKITNVDASKPFYHLAKKFDGVVTNPPFGRLSEAIKIDDFKISRLEHLMSIYALQTMKDSGKAAIVIGGHTKWDGQGRIIAGHNRVFLNYLYHNYRVADILLISGKKLYSRQGTSFDTRLILIEGRKSTPSGAAPLKTKEHSQVIVNHDQLFNRVQKASKDTNRLRLKARSLLIKQKQVQL